MQVKFWGVRGSIPTPEYTKMKVGGNTACVEVIVEGIRIILDMGTGIRGLGKKISQEIKDGKNQDILILLTHMHWDHIQGFPFFNPIYLKESRIRIWGPHKANRTLEAILAEQMEYDYFPIKLQHLPAYFEFHEIEEGIYNLSGGIKIEAQPHVHPGIAYGYRIEYKNKSVVYCTDIEHFNNIIDRQVVHLSREADLLIHDAQYTEKEIGYRIGWGHSTWKQAIATAKEAAAKQLLLFHYDPERTDEDAFQIEREARLQFSNTNLSKEGDVVTL